jgi:phosphatidate cytidylyltransferase
MSAVVIITAMFTCCWLDYRHNFGHAGIWLLPLAVLLAALATHEALSLFAAKGLRPIGWVVHAGTQLVMLSACMPVFWTQYPACLRIPPIGWPLLALVVAVFLAFFGEMRRYEKPGTVIINVALTLFTVCYVGLLMAFVGLVRLFGGNQAGMVALFSLVAVAKISDTGAYGFGRLFGRHKLVPRLSPGKTIEGAVGGFVAACVASFVMFRLIAPLLVDSANPCPWWSWLSFGILITMAAIFGDLAESLLKRDMAQKDSSNLVPGLGGVLDFLDSLLFAAPVAYACWAFGLVWV